MTSPFIKCARLVTSFFLTVALIFEMKAFSHGKALEIQKQFHLIYNEILRLKNFIHVHRQFRNYDNYENSSQPHHLYHLYDTLTLPNMRLLE